jgi:hypothetical protein
MKPRMETNGLCPVNGNVGAVDVGRRAVFQILQTRVAGLLGEAGLVSEIEKPTNTILTRLKVEVLDKSESAIVS